MFKKKNAVLLLAMTVALAACGGSGGGSAADPTSGKAVDGYLVGSTVLCDADKDDVADTGEAKVETIAGGNFTFPAGCSDTIVVTGGKDETTKLDFKGTLKAPAGSIVVTPLTTLLADTGMTVVELAKALGLKDGTDVTKLDPADGNNFELHQVTIAVQQIIQELAKTLGVNSDYSKVAAAVAEVLLANPNEPLIVGGVVNPATLSKAITSAFGTTAISPTDLAAYVEEIGFRSNEPLNAKDAADLADVATKNQDSATPPIDTAAIVLAAKEAAAKAIAVAEAALAAAKEAAAKEAADIAAAKIAAAEVALAAAKEAAAKAIAEAEAAAAAANDAFLRANYLALQSDSIKINGTPITYASLAAGVTIGTPKTIGLDFSITGTPVINTVAKLALELVEVGGQSRVLQLMIDKVNIKNTDGQLSIVPATTAKVYVYGHTSGGTDINLILSDLTFKPITVTNNSLTLNYESMVKKVLDSVDNNTQTTAQKFTSIAGNFQIKLAVDGLPVRSLNGLSALPSTKIEVKNTIQSVNGVGVTGKLTIQ